MEGVGRGLVKGCPSLLLQAIPESMPGTAEAPEHWDLSLALSTSLVWGCRSSLCNLPRPPLGIKPSPVSHWALGPLQGDLTAQCHLARAEGTTVPAQVPVQPLQ